MSDPQTELLRDHAEAERLLGLVQQSVDGDDCCDDLRAAWAQLESMLLDHMHTEERFFFAHVADEHRDEVERLRAEHARIRSALAKIGVEIELHSLRKPEVEALSQLLREHAAFENRTLYRWLAERDGARFQRAVERMLQNRLRREEAKLPHPPT